MRKKIISLAAVALLPIGAVIGATPAQASDTEFFACYNGSNCFGGTSAGYVSWQNRSATLSGNVAHLTSATYSTTVRFKAYWGSKLVETQTRTVSPGIEHKGFGPFSIGSTAGRGGVTRIDISICQSYGTQPNCGEPDTVWR